MTVVCNCDGCYFKSENNFCTKLTIMVDQNGMCRQHWNNGQRIQGSNSVQMMQGESENNET